MKNPGRVVIIGAGPTGLGAAHRLLELGHTDFIIIEAQETVGGLSASFRDNGGFWWDLGGHVQFSHYDYYDEVLSSAIPREEWLWHQRESWIRLKGQFVPYPFQYNIHRLAEDDRKRILEGLQRARAADGQEPSNFRAWLLQTFGTGLAEIFMFPYNFKVWAWPLEEMGYQWIGERVAVPDLERIQANIASGTDDVSWGPNNTFRFPLHGGTGAIWNAVAERIPDRHFSLGHKVTAIEADRCVLHTDKGATEKFDTLISTVPLDALVARTDPLRPQIKEAAKNMCHSSVYVLGVGLRGGKPEAMRTKCWMYFPESHSPYYRVTVFSNYSPENVPEGDSCWSLMAEVSESRYVQVDRRRLRDWTLQSMMYDGLIEPGAEVVSWFCKHLEYGYPIPFKGRDVLLDVIMPELEKHRIFSRGRFGGWRYEVGNQDHSFMQGVEVADRLLLGAPETTFFNPARANSMVFRTKKEAQLV